MSDAHIRAEHEIQLNKLQSELQERSTETSHSVANLKSKLSDCQDQLSKSYDVVRTIPEISESEFSTLPLDQLLRLLTAEQSKLRQAQQVATVEQHQLQSQLDEARQEHVSAAERLRESQFESEHLRAEVLSKTAEVFDVQARAENSSKMLETVEAQLKTAQENSIDLAARLDGLSASKR